MTTERVTEIEEAFVHLCDRTRVDAVGVGVYATRDGSTYPALIDMETTEVLALLMIPPVPYDVKVVN